MPITTPVIPMQYVRSPTTFQAALSSGFDVDLVIPEDVIVDSSAACALTEESGEPMFCEFAAGEALESKPAPLGMIRNPLSSYFFSTEVPSGPF